MLLEKEKRDFKDKAYLFISETFKILGNFLLGLFILTALITFAFLSIPIYFYRWFLAVVVVPNFFHGAISNPVTSTGNVFATEFLQKPSHPVSRLGGRNAIVINFVVSGASISNQEMAEAVQTCWLKNPNYPEFRQYVEYWLGFMFWKWDHDFQLENHLYFHDLKEEKLNQREKYVPNLIEKLINKPFPPKRSPWEIHVVRKYDDASKVLDGNGDDDETTVLILRVHHALADGFSILYAMEEFYEASVDSFGLPVAHMDESETTSTSASAKLVRSIRFVHDTGATISSLASRPKTHWHVPDRNKSWKQLYSRSGFIPVQKIKKIKTKLGATFTGTLLSCISAGVAKSLVESKMKDKPIDNLAALIPLPLPGHPKNKLRNHVTATIFDLPVTPGLNPMERLEKCELNVRNAKKSGIPSFGLLYTKIFGSHLAPVASSMLRNRVIPTGLTNFPGTANQVMWRGRKGLSVDFGTGGTSGVAGVAFMVHSYAGYIRIAATAESAVMDRADLNNLMGFICEEIDTLDHLSTSPS